MHSMVMEKYMLYSNMVKKNCVCLIEWLGDLRSSLLGYYYFFGRALLQVQRAHPTKTINVASYQYQQVKNQGKINRFTIVMNGKQGSKLVSSTCPQDSSHENTLLVDATLHFAWIWAMLHTGVIMVDSSHFKWSAVVIRSLCFFFSARKMLFEDDKTFSDTSSSDWEGWLSFVTDVMRSLSCMYLLYITLR